MNIRGVSRGFSIIEIIIVISIIGILASIVTISYSAIEANARDSERAAKAAVIASALEKYYEQNGEYPSCNSLTNSLETAQSTLGGINADILRVPSAQDNTNSIQCTDINTEDDIFSYTGDDSVACLGSEFCTEWILQYKKESSGEIVAIKSKHKVDVAIVSPPSLTLSSIGLNQASLTWSAVPGMSTYIVQTSSSSNFSSSTSAEFNTLYGTIYDLSPDSEYFFRVASKSGVNIGPWSETVDGTTSSLPPPSSLSATLSGTGGIANYSSTCQSGSTPEYRYATTHRSDGSTADSWGAWSSWSSSASNPAFISQGRYGRVLVEGRCSFGSGIYSASRYAKSAGEINQSTSGIGGSVSISGTAYPGAHSTATVTCPAGFTSYIQLSLRSRSSGGGTAWSPSGNNRGHDVTSSGGSGTTTVRTYSSTSTASSGQTGHIGSISNVVAGYPSNMHNWIGGYAATRLYRCISPYVTWRGVTSARSGSYNTPNNNSNLALGIQSITSRPAAQNSLTSY